MASRNTPGMTSENMSKAERRELARQKARELQEAEARKAKRTRITIIAGAVVAILAIVAAVVFVVQQGNKKNELVNPAQNVSENGTISLGQGEGNVALPGKVNEGKPVVAVYTDYMCTHCNDLEKQYGNSLINLAANGEITLEFHPVAIMGVDFSTVSAAADFYIASEAPEQYALFHSRVFSDLSDPAFSGGKLPTTKQLLDLATEVGVPEKVVDGLEDVLDEETYVPFVNKANEAFSDAGYTGTPTVTVDGEKLDSWGDIITKAEEKAGKKFELSASEPGAGK